jgi:hypothetical protein
MIAIPVPAYPLEPDPHDRMATAVHEAAHAVVARALGVEVTRVILEPAFPAPTGQLGVCRTLLRDEPANLWAQAVMALAGAIAEQRYANYPSGMLTMMGRSAWATDRANAERYLRQLDGAVSMQQAANMARHLVGEHWAAIASVAAALASDGEISGIALDRLWRE